jgi:glycosyltransferase involved in cell wall biosynthesis
MTLFTVAICTRNRENSLQRTLCSLEDALKPDCIWEVLIVDNGSVDGTQKIVADFTGRLPIVYEMEQRAGLSYARNKAVACAKGDYIVWTDDDVVVERSWLTAYADAFRQWPEVSIFGGKIVPTLVAPSPTWFTSALPLLRHLLAACDLGALPIAMAVEGDLLPYGANFAIRMTDQRQFAYDPRLGVAPGRRLLGEETQVIKSMLAKGLRGLWLPGCCVEHVIGRERQTLRYISDYYESAGATDIVVKGMPLGRRFFGVPLWLWRRAAMRWADYWFRRLVSPPDIWVGRLIAFAQDRGRIKHLLGHDSRA